MDAVVFDIDGTIIDTKAIAVAAYRQVGIELTDDLWGVQWRLWLPDLVGSMERAVEIHDMKTKIHAEMIQDLDPRLELSAADVARCLNGIDVNVFFLTASDERISSRVLQSLNIKYVACASGLTLAERIGKLQTIHTYYNIIAYVDDFAETVDRVKALGLNAVHYVSQTRDELWSQIWMR